MFSFLRRSTPRIGADECDRLWRDGAVTLLDVREEWEFQRGHVPGALHIPIGQLPRRFGELPRDHPIAVICASGHRSLGATHFLLERGFVGTGSVDGGMSRWARGGRPVERGPARAA